MSKMFCGGWGFLRPPREKPPFIQERDGFRVGDRVEWPKASIHGIVAGFGSWYPGEPDQGQVRVLGVKAGERGLTRGSALPAWLRHSTETASPPPRSA